jgi:Flp pilus assembly protein TadB
MTALFALGAVTALAAFIFDHRLDEAARRVAHRARRGNARETRAALPALVDAVAAGLASGLSLPVALAEVAPTLPSGLATPTRRAASALVLGAAVGEALAAYAGAVPDEDVAPLAVVLAAFARSGGRVGGSLARVAALMRGRLALEDERSALTAQGRVSAIVLVALAPLGALFFALATPDYAAVFLGEGIGLLGIAVGLEIAGALWLWRIVRATQPPPDLATFLDAVVVGLEAGLTFERALAALVERAPRFGRLPDARRLLADLALGRSLPDALRGFGRGGDDARVAALVVAATRFGAPLAGLLVIQAEALRTAERRRAEAAARRLPVLMLFPLSLTILPALLLVFLGPPLLSLLSA